MKNKMKKFFLLFVILLSFTLQAEQMPNGRIFQYSYSFDKGRTIERIASAKVISMKTTELTIPKYCNKIKLTDYQLTTLLMIDSCDNANWYNNKVYKFVITDWYENNYFLGDYIVFIVDKTDNYTYRYLAYQIK